MCGDMQISSAAWVWVLVEISSWFFLEIFCNQLQTQEPSPATRRQIYQMQSHSNPTAKLKISHFPSLKCLRTSYASDYAVLNKWDLHLHKQLRGRNLNVIMVQWLHWKETHWDPSRLLIAWFLRIFSRNTIIPIILVHLIKGLSARRKRKKERRAAFLRSSFFGCRCDYHHILEYSTLLANNGMEFEWWNDEIKQNEHLGGIAVKSGWKIERNEVVGGWRRKEGLKRKKETRGFKDMNFWFGLLKHRKIARDENCWMSLE
jgi:hypothetical protein